ncbi:MAG TPA: efflux RND transporter permease subunit, partial [Polyangiaceae bacterium]|nr:efflux RND transporter permease subunit [Polyangiaceae bacterium]
VIKVFFHPGAKIEAATAQITAAAQVALRSLPPGATSPLILRYSASNAPVLQLALHSSELSEQELFDYGVNTVRAGVATVQGAGVPYPYGGKMRQVMVDIDLARLYAWGLSPRDVTAAVNAQNLTLPTGSMKVGDADYPVLVNGSALSVAELNDIPLLTRGGTTVFLRDVANVRDGFAPQTSIVHANGVRSVIMPILKSAGASTLDVVSRVRAALPAVEAALPDSIRVSPLFDQSVFVRAAVRNVVHEALLAGGLTALAMLVFLGSWRSTLIVVVSIPLSLLVSVMALGALGHSLNVMTLGGMSLAVGILVDDATVELENVHRNLGLGKPLRVAILDGAREIALPAFVSTLCICIVFVPIALMAGSARSLFLPLGLAVIFAMLTSYFLSRTLVPTLVQHLLAAELSHASRLRRRGLAARLHEVFEAGFASLGQRYAATLAAVLEQPRRTLAACGAFTALSLCLCPLLGRDFFPAVDAGIIRLHARAAPGTRIEEAERLHGAVAEVVRSVVPAHEIENLISNIGVTVSPINLSMGDPSMISTAGGELLLSLAKEHAPTSGYIRTLRRELTSRFPDATFFFLAPDIATQVLNFGLSAPIDVQLVGPPGNAAKNLALARTIESRLREIPGAVDVHLHQVLGAPRYRVDVDRVAANRSGLTERDVANDLLISLSSSGQTAPNFWLDPAKGIQYSVAVQTPQYKMDSLAALQATPVGTTLGGPPQLLANLADVSRESGAVNITHHNALPTLDVLANVDGADLGSVADELQRVIASLEPQIPRGSSMRVRGQVESMEQSLRGLGYGLLLAVLLVYLLMVVNFQSWLDPLIISAALPAAIAGVVWMLFLSQTTLSVPALMGTILCVGVATANSVLLVSFANDTRRAGAARDAREAALLAGTTRLRPVLMTALAMVVGMLPMASGWGEGAEQNAPLGRAVIGGLLLATLGTLFIVPSVYARLRRAPPAFDDTEPSLSPSPANTA